MGFCGTHLWSISQEVFKTSVRKMCMNYNAKITYTSPWGQWVKWPIWYCFCRFVCTHRPTVSTTKVLPTFVASTIGTPALVLGTRLGLRLYRPARGTWCWSSIPMAMDRTEATRSSIKQYQVGQQTIGFCRLYLIGISVICSTAW